MNRSSYWVTVLITVNVTLCSWLEIDIICGLNTPMVLHHKFCLKSMFFGARVWLCIVCCNMCIWTFQLLLIPFVMSLSSLTCFLSLVNSRARKYLHHDYMHPYIVCGYKTIFSIFLLEWRALHGAALDNLFSGIVL